MPRATRRTLSALALLASLLVASAPASALDFLGPLYEEGERVEVTGLVTTPDGDPIEDVRVVLELYRKSFDIRKFRRTKGKVFKVSDRTNAEGEYSIAFPWDDYYNRFELVAGITVRDAEGETLVELERLDVKDRIERSSPAVAPLVVENHEFIETFRAFLATVDTADEQRVYQERGRPDKVESTRFEDRVETVWWYFEQGKVCRFVDGELDKVEEFEPVEEL